MALSTDQLRGGWCIIFLLLGWVVVGKSVDMRRRGSVLVLCAFAFLKKLIKEQILTSARMPVLNYIHT